MFHYQEGPLIGTNVQSVRPVSSLSSGSGDSGIYTMPPLPTARPPSVSPSGPSSPAIQINHLLHQTANLLAVNAQLRKEIEQVRAGAAIVSSGPELIPTHEMSAFGFEQQQNYNQYSLRVPCGKKSPKPESYKTVMCQAWLESKTCAFAENCRFAHGEAELRPARLIPRQNNKYKTKLCDKYTTTGLCPYGNRCLFIHPDNGNNAYIRPDKIVEVSQRHALADMRSMARDQPSRPITPVGGLPTVVDGLTPIGPTSIRGSRSQLHPHPSWPLEPSTFFREKNDDPEFRTPSPVEDLTMTRGTEEFSTPGRGSGYVSGGSTPSAAEISPFSTVSSSSLNLNITEDERDYELFSFALGFDNIAQELAKALELW